MTVKSWQRLDCLQHYWPALSVDLSLAFTSTHALCCPQLCISPPHFRVCYPFLWSLRLSFTGPKQLHNLHVSLCALWRTGPLPFCLHHVLTDWSLAHSLPMKPAAQNCVAASPFVGPRSYVSKHECTGRYCDMMGLVRTKDNLENMQNSLHHVLVAQMQRGSRMARKTDQQMFSSLKRLLNHAMQSNMEWCQNAKSWEGLVLVTPKSEDQTSEDNIPEQGKSSLLVITECNHSFTHPTRVRILLSRRGPGHSRNSPCYNTYILQLCFRSR